MTERIGPVVAISIDLPALLSSVDSGKCWLKGRVRSSRCWHGSHTRRKMTSTITAPRNVHCTRTLRLADGTLAPSRFILLILCSGDAVAAVVIPNSAGDWARQASKLASTGDSHAPCQRGLVARAFLANVNTRRAIWPLAIAGNGSFPAREAVVSRSTRCSSPPSLAWWLSWCGAAGYWILSGRHLRWWHTRVVGFRGLSRLTTHMDDENTRGVASSSH